MTMQKWIVPILFLAAPFAFLTPGLIWKSQLMFFLIMPVFILAANIKNVWVKTFLFYVMAWQFAIFILTFNRNAQQVIGPALSVIMAIMAGAYVYKFVSENDLPADKWFMFIRIAVIAQIASAIPQLWEVSTVAWALSHFTNVQEKLPGHLVGTLGNRNYLAAFVAVSVPMFAGWRTINVRGYRISPALVGIFVFLGFCLSPGTLAAIIGMGFFLTHGKKLWKRIIAMSIASKIAVIFAVCYVYATGNHLNEFQALPGQLSEFLTTGKITVDPFQGDVGRFAMWMMAISKLTAHWAMMVFGYGPGAYWGREYPIHGEYVSVLFQYGLIGLVIVLGYIFNTGKFLLKSGDKILATSFLIICLDCIGNFPMQIATTAFLIIIILGLIERERLKWQI